MRSVQVSCVAVALTLMLQAMAVAAGCSEGCSARSLEGHFRIEAAPVRGAVPLREHHDWIVTVWDADGEPLTLDGLSVTGGMPGHGHGLPSQPKVAEYEGQGRYRLSGFLFNMHGDWVLRFHLASRSAEDTVDLTLTLDY